MATGPLFIDIETQATGDLPEIGAPAYARTIVSVPCIAWAYLDGPVNLWLPRQPLDWLQFHEGTVVAHNSEFERAVLFTFFGLNTPVDRWEDTAALARSVNLPGKLEEVGEFMGFQKDMEGHQIMMKLCRPRRVSKENPDNFWTPFTKPDDFQALYRYCQRDVEVSREVYRRFGPMNPTELRRYHITLAMNARGVKVDLPAVSHGIRLAQLESDRLSARMEEITGASASQVGKLSKFLGMGSIAKASLRDALKDSSLAPEAREVLTLRQQYAKASVAKLRAFDRHAINGRLHDSLVYAGAERTCRWTGAGVQLQNVPRGAGEVSVEVMERLSSDGVLPRRIWDGDGTLYEGANEVIKQTMRAVLVGPFLVGDYGQIEARLLSFIAGDQKLLGAFERGEDPYKLMAAGIYHKDVEQVSKPERFMGKQAVLGCLGADTQVLTDSGYKRILDVDISDKLWDGESWVTHQGVIFSGMKPTIEKCGLVATADHLILAGNWTQWGQLTTTEIQSASSMVNLPLSGMREQQSLMEAKSSGGLFAAALAGRRTRMTETTSKKAAPPAAMSAPRKRLLRLRTKCIGVMRKYARMLNTEHVCLTESHRVSAAATVRQAQRFTITEGGAFMSTSPGGQTGARFFGTSWASLVGMFQRLSLTVKTLTEGTSRGIFALSQKEKTHSTRDQSPRCSSASQNLRPVYDILNSGPLNRFAVLTSHGPVLAHNCGYGLGHRGFQYLLDTVYDVQIEEGEASRIIDGYRRASPEVVHLWKKLDRALGFAAKVIGKRVVILPGLSMRFTDPQTMTIRLPSGRDLWYRRVEYRPREGWRAYGRDRVTKQMGQVPVHGGALTGHIVQSTARDIMAGALERLEDAGFRTVLSVHDEAVVESGPERLKEFEQTMLALPGWATGLPVKVDVFATARYRK